MPLKTAKYRQQDQLREPHFCYINQLDLIEHCIQQFPYLILLDRKETNKLLNAVVALYCVVGTAEGVTNAGITVANYLFLIRLDF